MDQPAVIITIAAVICAIVVVGFFVFRRHQNVKTTVTGPGGTSVTVEASTKPGSATIEGVKSGGKLLSESEVGGDARIANSEAVGDATARSTSIEGDARPKA